MQTWKAGEAAKNVAQGDVRYAALLPTGPDEGEVGEEVEEGKLRLQRLRDEEALLTEKLEDIDLLWSSRRGEILRDLEASKQMLTTEEENLDALVQAAAQEPPPQPPGPLSLRWVQGTAFSCACSLVIVFNLGTMAWEMNARDMEMLFFIANQCFLIWYVLELVLKAIYFQKMLLIGKVGEVCWNWLDLIIVVSGILDQWLMPLITLLRTVLGGHADGEQKGRALQSLRFIRLFRLARVMRVLKIGKVFLYSDFSWTEGRFFQSFIMGVIALNTILLGLELDIPWAGWFWVEQVLLIIYVFELAVRLKRWGVVKFFVHPDDWAWNLLDFIIVAGAVIDQWLTPTIKIIHELLGAQKSKGESKGSQIVMLLRVVRLVRILRLVRLLRAVKPLFKLMMGIVEAMGALMWVLVLTFIILYAFAILATSLVGHGLIFGDDAPEDAQNIFSTVPESMFLLFKLMNDDQSVINPVISSTPIRLLFVVFMVIANWAMLAILTSVMSESMISATHHNENQEARDQKDNERAQTKKRIIRLFSELDKNDDKTIDEFEFRRVLEDKGLSSELCDATGLAVRDLKDLFLYLSEEDRNGVCKVHYEDFVQKLQMESSSVVERSMFRLEKRVRRVESRVEKVITQRLDEIMAVLSSVSADESLGKPMTPFAESEEVHKAASPR